MIKSGYSPKRMNEDDGVDTWVTINGQHIGYSSEGKQVAGNPKVFGDKSSKSPETKDDNGPQRFDTKSKKDKPVVRDKDKFNKSKPTENKESVLDILKDIIDPNNYETDKIGDLIGKITEG